MNADANPLPCPFCGGHKITLIRRSNVHGAMGCDGCGAEGPAGQYTEAVAMWNDRAVPAGWKLAPIEPTEAMLKAAFGAMNETPSGTWKAMKAGNAPRRLSDVKMAPRYRAMLAAAPEPPAAMALHAARHAAATDLLAACRELVSIRDWMVEVGRACEGKMTKALLIECAERQARAIPAARAAIAKAMGRPAGTGEAS